MILVDLYVPSMNQSYDFQLNEKATVASVILEVADMISQKERVRLVGDAQKLNLCDKDRNIILFPNETLEAGGIHTGSRLILV